MRTKWPESISNRPTMLYEKSLRSGQSIKFEGNVVVLGDVNAGAEIVADGHILVMGKLRGLVHAGAGGEEGATVSALDLAPTQLRIASHITRPPDGADNANINAETARIRNDEVVIEEYQSPR